MIHLRAIILLPLLSILLTGCEAKQPTVGPIETGPAEPGALETTSTPDPAPVDAAAANPVSPSGADRYTMEGLVGQVNGKPIYARTILEPMKEQLTQIANQYSGREYQEIVVTVLQQRLNEEIQNALILGEAERDLSEEEQQGLAYRIAEYRQELLRLYGRGSVAVAEQALRDERGIGLEEAVEEERVKVVVGRYIYQKVVPLINVTRRDIERYYNDHPELFNPPAHRVVRLINVGTPEDAQVVIDAISDSGADFTELASREFNRFKPSEGGRMELVGETSLALPQLNEQLLVLGPGQHAGPFSAPNGAQWFIYVESVDQPAQQSLKDAQVAIENQLRDRQYLVLSEQFRKRITDEGSYTDMEDMIARLYAIVLTRYKPALALQP